MRKSSGKTSKLLIFGWLVEALVDLGNTLFSKNPDTTAKPATDASTLPVTTNDPCNDLNAESICGDYDPDPTSVRKSVGSESNLLWLIPAVISGVAFFISCSFCIYYMSKRKDTQKRLRT
jgi:hypothetical protein